MTVDEDVHAAPSAPGKWAVLIGAALAILAGLALAVVYVTPSSRDQLGTNGVAAAAPIIQFQQGQRLCVRALRVPAGTGEVQLWLGRQGAEAIPVSGTLELAGGRTIVVGPAQVPTPGMTPIPLASPVAHDAIGRLCLTRPAKGPALNVGGAGTGNDGRGVTVSIDGKPLARSEPTVRFFPPAGVRTGVAQRFGDGLQRMAHLSPSGFPAWALAVVVFLLLPAALLALLWNVAVAPRRTVRRIAAACTAASLVICTSWAIITPVFQGPDESEHVAYSQYFAENFRHPESSLGGSLPPFSSQQAVALDAVRHFPSVVGLEGRLRWDAMTSQDWREATKRLPAGNGGGYTTAGTGHSVLYYALVAPGYWVGETLGGFAGSMFGVRLITALLASLIAGITVLIAAMLVPGRRRPLALAGLVAATVPMAGAVGGSVNNDTLVNLFSATGLLIGVALLTGRRMTPWLLAAGAIAVILPIAKGTGFEVTMLVAFVVVATAVLTRSLRGAGRVLLLTAAGACACAGILALMASLIPGQSITLMNTHGPGSGPAAAAAAAAAAAGDGVPKRVALDYVVQTFVPWIHLVGDQQPLAFPLYDLYTRSLFGGFGWARFFFPVSLDPLMKLAVFGALGLGAIAAVVRRRELVGSRLAVAFLALAPVVTLSLVAWVYAAPGGRAAPAEQGRYLLPALAALAVWVAAAPAVLPPGRARALLTGALAGGFVSALVGALLVAGQGWFV